MGDHTNFPGCSDTDSTYDLVTCTHVIHWVKDKDLAFKNVHRYVCSNAF